jgi:CRP-like cAMP-binding protein
MQLDPAAFHAGSELIAALKQRAATVGCPADRILFLQGEVPNGIYILEKGEVVLSMSTPTGKTVTDARARSGSLLGLPGLVSNEPYTMTAVAQPGAELSFLDRQSFAHIMHTCPTLAIQILQVLAAEVRSARLALVADC